MATAVTITITLAMLVICASGAVPGSSRPDPSDAPATARWLVAQSAWGVLRYVEAHALSRIPFWIMVSIV